MDIGGTIRDKQTGDRWTITSITAAGISYEEGNGASGYVVAERFDEVFEYLGFDGEQPEPMIDFGTMCERAAKEICRMEERDPEMEIAVQPFPGAVVDANGHAHVPLWKTIVPDVRNYLMLTEAVKRVLRGAA